MRRGNDSTSRACCPNSAAPGAVKPGMDDEPVVPRPCSRRQDNRKWNGPVGPRIRRSGVTEYWIGTAASVCLDVGRADHLAPLLGFCGDEFAEVGRRADKRCAAQVGQPLLNLGIG